MHIAVVHGYLLRGTGSNLYVQNLCREFCRLGHHVSLFCQEENREEYDFISRAIDYSASNGTMEVLFERETGFSGKCTAYRPNLGGFLPVYVLDQYKGYLVKEFTKLSVAEIEEYNNKNQAALETAFKASCPDLIMSNHLIMQPLYATRACRLLKKVPHFLTVHGSCLNFSVRKSLLLKDYARVVLQSVDKIFFVSDYSRQDLLHYFEDEPNLRSKTSVNPAGVDISIFSPLQDGENKSNRIANLISLLRETDADKKGRTKEEKEKLKEAVARVRDKEELPSLIRASAKAAAGWLIDPDRAERLDAIDWQSDPVILYYGKYLWTKGPQLLIAAAPLVIREKKNTHFILVGFGSFRSYLEALVYALDYGRRDLFYELILQPGHYSKEIEPETSRYIHNLAEKLQNNSRFAGEYFGAAYQNIARRIIFTGYMGHNYLKDLIPCSDITVAPSVFPEAFGMVAIEALASGVIPVQTNHSGFAEVLADYSSVFHEIIAATKLKPLLLNEELVLNLASNLLAYIQYYEQISDLQRQQIRQRASQLAASKYSWNSIALSYLKYYAEIDSEII